MPRVFDTTFLPTDDAAADVVGFGFTSTEVPPLWLMRSVICVPPGFVACAEFSNSTGDNVTIVSIGAHMLELLKKSAVVFVFLTLAVNGILWRNFQVHFHRHPQYAL